MLAPGLPVAYKAVSVARYTALCLRSNLLKGVDFIMATYPWEIQSKYPPRGVSSNGMDIVENPDTDPVLIGHTLSYCSELENALNEAITKAEGYFDELVAAGLRAKPVSTEEMLVEAMKAIKHLSDKIDRLEGAADGHKSNAGSSQGNSKQDKPKGSGSAGKPAANSASKDCVQ